MQPPGVLPGPRRPAGVDLKHRRHHDLSIALDSAALENPIALGGRHATSSDGFTWNYRGLATGNTLDPGGQVLAPSVIWEDGLYKMWYNYMDPASRRYVHFDTSDDGEAWRLQGPVLGPQPEGPIDQLGPTFPDVHREGTGYVMWYACATTWEGDLYRARSRDGTSWTRDGIVLPRNPSDPLQDVSLAMTTRVALNNGVYRLWYWARGSQSLAGNIFTGTTTSGVCRGDPRCRCGLRRCRIAEGCEGESVSVEITVENQGASAEVTEVSLLVVGAAAAQPQPVTLAVASTTTLHFVLDTTSAALGDHAIGASVAPVQGEINLRDNALESGRVTLYERVLTLEAAGQFDYLLREPVRVRVAVLVRDASTVEPVSGANVSLQVYDPAGNLLLTERTREGPPGSGIYDWTSARTIRDMALPKGVYLVHIRASYAAGPAWDTMLLFHIDPPTDESQGPLIFLVGSQSLWVLTMMVGVMGVSTGVVIRSVRRASRRP